MSPASLYRLQSANLERKSPNGPLDSPKYVTTRSHADVDSDDSAYLVLKRLILYSVLVDGTYELVL